MITYMQDEEKPDQQAEQWFTPKEVAAILKLNPRKVGDLLRSGTLPSIKIGNNRRIKAVDLQAFTDALKEQKEGER